MYQHSKLDVSYFDICKIRHFVIYKACGGVLGKREVCKIDSFTFESFANSGTKVLISRPSPDYFNCRVRSKEYCSVQKFDKNIEKKIEKFFESHHPHAI